MEASFQVVQTNNDKEFVQYVLNIILTGIHERIKRITTFYKDYTRVYDKYKHIFTPQIGTCSIEENIMKPRIFIRDQYKRQKITRKATYVVPTTLETVEYYEKVKDDVSKVFLTLLESHVHIIQNCGKSFLIPDGFFLPNEKKNDG
jgi:hypothetical protein